jgi:hypothetical protein
MKAQNTFDEGIYVETWIGDDNSECSALKTNDKGKYHVIKVENITSLPIDVTPTGQLPTPLSNRLKFTGPTATSAQKWSQPISQLLNIQIVKCDLDITSGIPTEDRVHCSAIDVRPQHPNQWAGVASGLPLQIRIKVKK